MVLRRGLLIGGVESDEGPMDLVVDPSTGVTVAEVARATAKDVERAVQVAHRAFEQAMWSRTPPPERGRILARVAALISERREDLARLESRQAGKPISAARGEIGAVARTFEYYAGSVDKFGGQTIPGGADGTLLTFREPVGVCGIITPWNFPMVILGWKLAPALAMGNSVVIKPASATPLTALALADICAEAGVPAGVVNVVPGPGSIAGDALVGHPLVRKISFTGSTAVGADVMRIAAPDIKRVSLELGGKSANVVFADADLDDCVQSSVFGAYDNTGQDCCSRSRILVERSVFDEFVERFTARAGTLVVGPTDDEDTELGPLISDGHRDSVE
ncbi:MAG: aldehyde dehydrogenase, partial [Acidimicrobiia bacterium]|nr:aldehyde dehydrogenase [Acidimicrobiia bacterium]